MTGTEVKDRTKALMGGSKFPAWAAAVMAAGALLMQFMPAAFTTADVQAVSAERIHHNAQAISQHTDHHLNPNVVNGHIGNHTARLNSAEESIKAQRELIQLMRESMARLETKVDGINDRLDRGAEYRPRP